MQQYWYLVKEKKHIFPEKKDSWKQEILFHDNEDYDDAADADTDDDWRPLGGLGALVNKMMTR